ncbi:MAG: ATP-binding protein [Brachybacterium sp.]|nr:ATP-binding protein [Brachybacterium sp.]
MSALIRRHLLRQAQDLMDHFPAVVIQGARQVGKSTLASMLAVGTDHVSVTFDDDDVRESALLDPRAFVRQAGDGLLVIDEVQREPSVLLAIKSLIDADRKSGRFLLTGSSDLLRLTRSPDSLAGRAVTVDLHGLSQGELVGTVEDFAHWIRNGLQSASDVTSGWSRERYAEAMTTGGYPEVHRLPRRHRATWFDSYIDRVLTRDISEVSRGLSSDRLDAVLRLIAANQGGELVQARLADNLSMARSSVAGYLAALSTMYLTHDLRPWRANLTKREVGRHKVSVADPGLAARMSRVSAKQLTALRDAPILGMQLEAFVVGQLMAQRGWSKENFEIYHFRDRDGLEVDVVLEFDDGHVFLIEVKASTTIRADHTRGIRDLADRLGDRFLGGAVLGLVERARPVTGQIWALPVSALWEHPDSL